MLAGGPLGAAFLKRQLKAAEPTDVANALVNLRPNARNLGPDYTLWMLAQVKDNTPNARKYAGFLIHIYDRVCARDPEKFNTRIHSDDAHAALSAYVKRLAADETQKKWAKTAAPILGVKLD